MFPLIVPESEADYLTTSEVARMLRLSSERVRQLARNGQLPVYSHTKLGRLWTIETVEQFAASRRAAPSSDEVEL